MTAAEREEKKRLKLLKEYERLDKLFDFDMELAGGLSPVCGVDEVGRGPLAGPVMAGAVILPEDKSLIHLLLHLNDSKKLSEKRREELNALIGECAVAFSVGEASEERIDEINILQADYEAMEQAVRSLSVKPAALILDAVHVPQLEDFEQISVIKGDMKSASIAAASIIAKVKRDRFMTEAAERYPEYGFERNKGYGTAEHIAAIKRHGPCPLHRRSFIKNFV